MATLINLLFLDIDGVLNQGFKHPYGFEYTTPEAVQTLNHILKKYDFDIIISSSWREIDSLASIEKFFKDQSVDILKNDKSRSRIIGATPIQLARELPTDDSAEIKITSRIVEIVEAFNRLPKNDKKYKVLIIDDQPLIHPYPLDDREVYFFENLHMTFEQQHTLKTEYRVGLTKDHILIADEIMEKQ